MATHARDDRQAIDQASTELTPIPLMQIITGFWAAKTLAAAVELDLLTTLAGTGTDAQELTQVLGLPARPAEMLLSACAAFGLLEKREGRYDNHRSQLNDLPTWWTPVADARGAAGASA
jgi:hypothetical protein